MVGEQDGTTRASRAWAAARDAERAARDAESAEDYESATTLRALAVLYAEQARIDEALGR